MTIKLTPQAIKQVQEMFKRANLSKGIFRVGVEEEGCSGLGYYVDVEEEGKKNDHVFEQEQGIVVCVDPESYPVLKGTLVDYVREQFQERFIFQNPNSKGTCGCGESFNA